MKPDIRIRHTKENIRKSFFYAFIAKRILPDHSYGHLQSG